MTQSRLLNDGDMYSTGAKCPACHAQWNHTEEELRAHHPFARHGVGADGKWTDPGAQAAHDAEAEALAKKASGWGVSK
jgi:hypothetical protein